MTVLDRGNPQAAASWGNAGWICPSLSGPIPSPGLVTTSLKWMLRRDSPLYIKPRFDLMLIQWLWDFWRRCNSRDYRAGLDAVASLNRRTLSLYDALLQGGVQIEMHQAGLLFLFLTPAGLRHSLKDFELLKDYGYHLPTRLSREDLRPLVPGMSGRVIGGYLVEAERHVRPDSLTVGLANRLSALGADLRPGVVVRGFQRQNGRVMAVVTDQGPVTGDKFLIAAGAWSGILAQQAGFHLPIQAGKGYSVTITKPTMELAHPLYLGEAKVGLTPFNSTLRIAGTMELSGINLTLDRQRIAAIRQAVGRYVVGWEKGDGEMEWSGMRPLTPDGLPVLGRAPHSNNLYVATGHAMLGVTMAPVTGVVMADLIVSGQPDIDIRPFDPRRFNSRCWPRARTPA